MEATYRLCTGRIGDWGSWVSVSGTLEQAESPDAGVRDDGASGAAVFAARRAENDSSRRLTRHSGRRRRHALMIADGIGLLGAAAMVGVATTLSRDAGAPTATGVFLLFSVAIIPLWAAFAGVAGLYRREEQRADLSVVDDLGPTIGIACVVAWIMVVVASLTGIAVTTNILVALWAAMIVLVLTSRIASRAIVRRSQYMQNTLIVGAGDVGQLLGRKLMQHPELGLRLLGFVDDDPKSMRRDLEEIATLGTPAEIRELVVENEIDRVMIAFSNEHHNRELELVHALRDLDVQIEIVPRLFEAIGPVVRLHYVEGLPLVVLPSARSTHVARAAKRVIDIVASAIALVFLSPLFLVIAWKVKRGSPGPILFRQERLGQDMRPFEFLKFRTMYLGTDVGPHREYVRSIMDTSEPPTGNSLYKLSRDDAVTGFGSWLRRTSLDELPQLVNVLRGDMSLVGPRPCMPYETELFEPHHFDRFQVPAGMTGLWQVTARARSTFKEALDLDVAYVHNWSLALDFKLLFDTPLTVFRARRTT